MVIPNKKAVGIFGGSFDPPHEGHLKISEISLKKMKFKKIYWIVTKKNPFKDKPFYSLKERLEKSRKAAKKLKRIKVLYLDDKIKSSNTIGVVNYFRKIKKQKNLYLILGSDNLVDFHKWTSWKKIVKLVKLVVFSRKGYDKKGMKSIVVKNFKNKIIFIKNKPFIISSTQLKMTSKIK